MSMLTTLWIIWKIHYEINILIIAATIEQPTAELMQLSQMMCEQCIDLVQNVIVILAEDSEKFRDVAADRAQNHTLG